jgi:predicted enzyme related to lactoylglutathione lyase
MSERDGYQPGVPCWIACVHPDPEKAVTFYTELFGWEATNLMPPDADGPYFLCRLRGRDVAAVVSQHGAPPPPASVWTTHIWVESADDTAAKVAEAGGSVVADPFDSPGGGRVAVLSDASGAVFCVWQPGERKGAQVVNEPGAWSMSALNTRDPQGAKAFYGAVFGWDTDTFDLGESEVTLWRLPGYVGGEPEQPVPRDLVATMAPMTGDRLPDDVPAHWSVDFWVHDVDATAEKAAQLGGKVVVPPYDIPVAGLRQAVLADPQGAAFSVSKVAAGGMTRSGPDGGIGISPPG